MWVDTEVCSWDFRQYRGAGVLKAVHRAEAERRVKAEN